MKKTDFLKLFQSELEIESAQLKEDTNFNSLPEYTSLFKLGIIAFVDNNFNKRISNEQLKQLTDVRSLMELIGMNNFEE